jgi:dTDP-4-dehydrorhamnose 3,5-epimerase
MEKYVTKKENYPKEIEILDVHTSIDERGSWLRVFDSTKSEHIGLSFSQISISNNLFAGTLRGLHFQLNPFSEFKAITCVRGSVYDVVVDMRESSSHYLKWYSLILNSKNLCSILIPPGYAHGFMTLEDNTQLMYGMDKAYSQEHYCGLHWNDPKIGIRWPSQPKIISDKDAGLPWI